MKTRVIIPAMLLGLQLAAQDSSKPAPAVLTYKTYTSFPAFPLLTLDSTRFNTSSLRGKNEQIVVIYFSPTCSHCQHQAEEITSHMKDFKDVKFLMVSSYALSEI